MTKETSAYLDLVRFLAAITVMFSHFGGRSWTAGFGWQFVRFGAPAVIVFFVLSGFVIAYVTKKKETDWRSYTISRAARLYSVCVPALAITVILSIIGTALHPTFPVADPRPTTFIRSIFFVHQLWFSTVVPGIDGPYWSLGYEVPYYVLFGLAIFAPQRWRLMLVALGAMIAGPRIILMMPIWLMGVVAFRLSGGLRISTKCGFAIWFLTAGALITLAIATFKGSNFSDEATAQFARPFPDIRSTAIDYLVGILIAANFVGFDRSAGIWAKVASRAKAGITWLAGATFTIYLVHYPVALFLIAISPWPIGSWAQRGLVVIGTIIFVFLAAEIGERRKTFWRVRFQKLLEHMFGPKPNIALPADVAIESGKFSR